MAKKAIIAALLFIALTAGVASVSSRHTPDTAVYWGAYIDAVATYTHLYGGAWSNAPWCDPGTQCGQARFEQDAGKKISIVHYGVPPPWEAAFDPGAVRLVQRRGDIAAIDMSTGNVPLAAIASGTYDSEITSWAQAAEQWGHPLFLLLDEEMNGTWYPYSPGQNGNTAGDFVAAWRHMHDIFTSVGATNVTWVWCPNVVNPAGGGTPLGDLYPGDDYVDWTGLNGYNWGGAGWTSFAKLFEPSYKALLQLAPSKPIMIGETASAEAGGSKTEWITNALSDLPKQFPQVKAFLWFNWRIYEKHAWRPWEIESSPGAQEAFAAGINSSYYAPGGTFGDLALLTKIQPLP